MILSTKYKFAKDFAIAAHGGQMYGKYPYEYHLCEVADTYIQYGFFDESRIGLSVAYLHDVLEDTNTLYTDLDKVFGEDVADAVLALTNINDGDGNFNLFATLVNIRENETALMVKLCDRLCNMRLSLSTKNAKMMRKYASQFDKFELALYNTNRIYSKIWDELRFINHASIEELKRERVYEF